MEIATHRSRAVIDKLIDLADQPIPVIPEPLPTDQAELADLYKGMIEEAYPIIQEYEQTYRNGKMLMNTGDNLFPQQNLRHKQRSTQRITLSIPNSV